MNNTTSTRTLTILVVLMTATLAVAVGTLAVTSAQSALAYAKKDRNGNNNGNTITHQITKEDGIQSGFDGSFEQETSDLICTHPSNNATCTQEGVVSPTSSSTSKPTTGTLLVTVSCSSHRDIPPFCPDPSDFIITVTGNNPRPSTFPGSGTGTLVTLGPGEFTVTETNPGPFNVFFSGDCKRVTDTASAAGTISAGEHKTCQVGNGLPG
jgi:hypothetical protein